MKLVAKRLRAFTLIELLIVITIIGILAVALVPRIIGGPEKARDASRKADLQQIATALEFYADSQGGTYPGTASTVECLAVGQTTADALIGDYIASMPADPTSNRATTDGSTTCTGSYYYSANSDLSGYVLMANLEADDATGQGKGLYELPTSAPTALSDLTECTASCTDVYYAVGR